VGGGGPGRCCFRMPSVALFAKGKLASSSRRCASSARRSSLSMCSPRNLSFQVCIEFRPRSQSIFSLQNVASTSFCIMHTTILHLGGGGEGEGVVVAGGAKKGSDKGVGWWRQTLDHKGDKDEV